MMNNEKKVSTAGSKKKIVIAAMVIIVIIFVAVGAALVNLSAPSTSINQGGEDTEEAHKDMDFNMMFQSSVNKSLEILETDPDNLEALRSIASTYYMWAVQIHEGSMQSEYSDEELFQKSADYYERAVELDPSDLQTIAHLGYTYFDWAQHLNSGDNADKTKELYEKSIKAFDSAKAGEGNAITDEEVSNMTINKAIALLALDKVDEGIAILEELRLTDENNPTLLINLGIFYETKGDSTKAKECYESAHSIAHEAGNDDLASVAQERIDALSSK